MSGTINKIRFSFVTLAVTGIILLSEIGTVQAGFEWTPPPQRTAPPAVSSPAVSPPSASPPSSASMQPVEATPIKPNQAPHTIQTLEMEELESDPAPVMKVKAMTQPKHQPEMRTNKVPPVNVHKKPQPRQINPFPRTANAPRMIEPSTKTVSQPPQHKAIPENYAEVVGFGSDLPLALALRQVVPPEYSFSFGDGVNAGYRVSWNGSRPWNEVITDMVAPLNLSARIHNKTVVIEKSGEEFSALAPHTQKPHAGTPKRKNITDPGMSPKKLISNQLAMKTKAKPENNSLKTWEAKQGDSLKTTLDTWSEKAGIELIWNASHDYALDSNITIKDTFGGAIEFLFTHALNPSSGPAHDILNIANTGEEKALIVKDKS